MQWIKFFQCLFQGDAGVSGPPGFQGDQVHYAMIIMSRRLIIHTNK